MKKRYDGPIHDPPFSLKCRVTRSLNCEVDNLPDIARYRIPLIRFRKNRIFSKTAFLSGVVLKRPSRRGVTKLLELFDVIDDLGRPWHKEVQDTFGISKPMSPQRWSEFIRYYALLLAVQRNRLLRENAAGVPTTKVGICRFFVLGAVPLLLPIVIQRRVVGTLLWDMFDHGGGTRPTTLKRDYWRYQAHISMALIYFGLHSDLDSYLIDWNPKNFVFDSVERCLYYVDSKLGFLADRSTNFNNQSLLKKHFL